MAVVDSLEVHISASMEKANQSIKEVVKGLGLITEGITAITKNSGLEEFSKRAREFSVNISDIGKQTSESMKSISDASEKVTQKANEMGKSISESMKPVSKSTKIMSKDMEQAVSEFQNRFKDLGKGFSFAGTTEQMRKETDKLFNNLEKAKVELQRLTLSDNIDSSQLENAVAKVMELQNKYGSLQKTLEEGSRAYHENLSRATEQVSKGADILEKEAEHLSSLVTGMNYGEGIEGLKNQLSDYEDRLKNTLQEAKSLENAGAIKTDAYTEAIAQAEKYRDKIRQLKAEIQSQQATGNGLEIGELSGSMQQLRNMGDLISQTFSDLKSGEVWRYLSDSVGDYIKNAQLASGIKINTEEYQNVLNDIGRTENALEKLEQKKRDMEASGTNKESKDWQNVTDQIEAAQRRLEQYTAQRYRLEGTGADTEFTGGLADQSWIKSALAVASEAMASLRQKIGEIGGAVSQAVGNIPIVGRVAKEAAFLGQIAFEGLRIAMSGVVSVGKGVFNVFSVIGSAAKNLTAKVKGALSGFTGLGKSSKGLNLSLGKGFTTLLKYGLGIRSVYMLINKLRRAIVDGFKNLSLYSNEVNASLSMLKSSLNTFKNASAAALSPLLNAMAPALNTIIQACTRATNAINQLLSALFGKGMWIRAKDQALNFAAGVKKAGKEAKNGTRQFDELKLISTDSGGGGTNPADMFETVPIDDKLKDWADKLKEMWKNADFTELGSSFGDWLKNALDSIDWDSIKEKAAKLGASFATFLNGVFETEGLGYSIGNTLAQGINTGFEFLNEFVHTLDWESVGQFMAESINGLLENIDWELITDTFVTGAKGFGDAINTFTEYLNWEAVSTTISNFINTFVDTIYTFVTTVDWSTLGSKVGETISNAWTGIDWTKAGETVGESFIAFFDFVGSAIENVDWWAVGKSVKDFLVGIDWAGVADSFFEAVGAAFGGLAAFLGGLIADSVVNIGDYFNGKIEEAGGNVVEGILVGIAEALVNIGEWIEEHIFKPFLDGFKKAFDIHSPSKVMEEQGNFIIEGLLNGITSLVDKVTETWESMKNTAIETWETVSSDLSEKWETLKTDASTKFGEIKSNISEAWENLKSDTSDKWENIKSDLSEVWEVTKENASDKFGEIKDSVTDSWNELKKNTTDIWDGIKNAIKTPINGIIGFINRMISGIVSGINTMASALNSISFDVPEWVPGIGGKAFSLDIPQISAPQIPMLAKGAVFRGGKPFAAIVNDQPRGQTNVETPLKVIKQALREELTSFTDKFSNVQLTPTFEVGQFQPAPPPNFNFARQRQETYERARTYQAEQERHMRESYGNFGNGGFSDDMKKEFYELAYSAFSAAMNNNKRLREMDEHIAKGHTIEMDGRKVAQVVQNVAAEYFGATGGKSYFPI